MKSLSNGAVNFGFDFVPFTIFNFMPDWFLMRIFSCVTGFIHDIYWASSNAWRQRKMVWLIFFSTICYSSYFLLNWNSIVIFYLSHYLFSITLHIDFGRLVQLYIVYAIFKGFWCLSLGWFSYLFFSFNY